MPHSIPLTYCRLRLAGRQPNAQAPALGRVFGSAFHDEVRSHFYGDDGRPLHEYPRIQFKVMESTAILLGIAEGALFLQRCQDQLDSKEPGDEQFRVLDWDFESQDVEITASTEPIEYRFATPWLALNQKNFRSYVGSRSTKFRKDELSRILVANCMGFAKSLGITFSERIDADCLRLTSIKTAMDGHGMVGFVGKFQVNLVLPEYLGLGKSVSRGFGTLAAGPG